jgi:hypothetical protein
MQTVSFDDLNDLPFTIAFDYSLRDASGNSACRNCPSGFAFLLTDSSTWSPNTPGTASPGFGLGPTSLATKRIAMLFDHGTACSAVSNTNFHGLYNCQGTSACTAYGSATNAPLTYAMNSRMSLGFRLLTLQAEQFDWMHAGPPRCHCVRC